jgi:hypothetical protein
MKHKLARVSGVGTSTLMTVHARRTWTEFLRLLFLQAHRETEAHFTILECHATQLGQVPFSPRGLVSRTEEQSRTRGSQSGGIEDQPEYRRMWSVWRCRTPCVRSFSRSPSRHPPLPQYPFPPRSLVRGGLTSPHKSRIVVSHSACPQLSFSPTRTALY